MQTMQPILTEVLEDSDDYIYEIKYDGFRAMLYWERENIKIVSRRNVDLTSTFPEITAAMTALIPKVKEFLPLKLDGELVILNHPYEANFSFVQWRGRLKNKKKIDEAFANRPAVFLAFDIVQFQGRDTKSEYLIERKQLLHQFFDMFSSSLLQNIPVFPTYKEAKQTVIDYKSEGVIAKRKKSIYQIGKQHRDWWKEKNWRLVEGFLTAYDPASSYYELDVFNQKGEVTTIGHCKHGLSPAEETTLKELFTTEGVSDDKKIYLPPAICASVQTLGMNGGELREPSFAALEPGMDPAGCTVDKLQRDLAMMPDSVDYSNENKVYWKAIPFVKRELLIYMRNIYPYMIPYIKDRALTVIRCPEGVEEECFFQKHIPGYGPAFIQRQDERIVCNRPDALLWLVNHGGIEYHMPFERLNDPYPDNIVFDLDPPSQDDFSMAVETALLFKRLFNELKLKTFIKTSGNKGLQIHLPIIKGSYTYEETAAFTANIAAVITETAPQLCTMERLKKKRNGRLYIDHVQHGKKKTIIAPYSPRSTPEATVATPLDWSEVEKNLFPAQFTLQTVVERVRNQGCPWIFEYEEARKQSFETAEPLFQT